MMGETTSDTLTLSIVAPSSHSPFEESIKLHRPPTHRSKGIFLEFFPCHISYDIISTDYEDTLLSVKYAVSSASPPKDKWNYVKYIINLTGSNKVRLRSRTSHFFVELRVA